MVAYSHPEREVVTVHFKFNPQFYRTPSFGLGLICGLVELSLWRMDNTLFRTIGLGTAVFLMVVSLGWDAK